MPRRPWRASCQKRGGEGAGPNRGGNFLPVEIFFFATRLLIKVVRVLALLLAHVPDNDDRKFPPQSRRADHKSSRNSHVLFVARLARQDPRSDVVAEGDLLNRFDVPGRFLAHDFVGAKDIQNGLGQVFMECANRLAFVAAAHVRRLVAALGANDRDALAHFVVDRRFAVTLLAFKGRVVV